MNNKKQIFSTTLTIVVSIFLVSIGVYAATTIGTDIDTGGTLDVTGLATFDHATTTSATSTDYLYVGENFSEDGNMDFASGDLFVSGDVNVGGVVYLDGALQATSTSLFTGAATFYDRVKIGTSTTSGVILDGTDPDQLFQTHAKIDADIANGAYSSNYTTMTVTSDLGGSHSVFGSWSELYLTGDLTLSTDNFGAIWGNLELTDNGGSLTFGGGTAWAGALVATLISPDGMVIDSGRDVAGVIVDSNITASYTNNGTLSGIVIRKAASSVAWPVGLTIKDSAATTGIDVGTATTGINFSGAQTNNIVIATAPTGTDGSIIKAGTSGAHLITTTANTNFLEFRLENSAATGDNRGIYNRLYLTGTAGTGGGESLRSYTDIAGATLANAHGAHISLGMGEAITSSPGSISGLGVAVRATLGLPDVALPSGGTYAALESEIYSFGANSDAGAVTELSFIRVVNGGNAAGMITVDDDAFLLVLDDGFIAGSGHLWDSTISTSTPQIDHTLKIKISGTTYYIPVMDTVNGL